MNTYAITIRTCTTRIKYFAVAATSCDALDAALQQFGADDAVGVTACLLKRNQ